MPVIARFERLQKLVIVEPPPEKDGNYISFEFSNELPNVEVIRVSH